MADSPKSGKHPPAVADAGASRGRAARRRCRPRRHLARPAAPERRRPRRAQPHRAGRWPSPAPSSGRLPSRLPEPALHADPRRGHRRHLPADLRERHRRRPVRDDLRLGDPGHLLLLPAPNRRRPPRLAARRLRRHPPAGRKHRRLLAAHPLALHPDLAHRGDAADHRHRRPPGPRRRARPSLLRPLPRHALHRQHGRLLRRAERRLDALPRLRPRRAAVDPLRRACPPRGPRAHRSRGGRPVRRRRDPLLRKPLPGERRQLALVALELPALARTSR